MEEIDIKVGALIRAKRKSKKLTQTELAKMVGTTTQCIYYYENALRGLPISLFFKICDELNITHEEIDEVIK